MNTEVRSSIDTLHPTLKERLAQPGQSLLPPLTSMSRFAKCSLANQFLVFAQRPDATCVQGYRAWNKTGHQVRQGEHGIVIYAPMRFAQRDSNTLDDGATESPRLGFRVAYVFDVSHVDALPGTASALETASTLCPSAHRHLEALKAFLVGHNVELEYKALAPGLLGYTNGRRIAGTEAFIEYIQSYRGTPGTLDASLERIRNAAQRLSAEIGAIITFDPGAA